MRATEKLDLVDQIGRTLQAKYTFTEIDRFLAEFGISAPRDYSGNNSKWVYTKTALQGVAAQVLLTIAEELEIKVPAAAAKTVVAPRNWRGVTQFRLFISHISKDKSKALRLKDSLKPYGISGFVAHEDIHPTLEWQDEIERALRVMDAFIAIHTAGFSSSYWTQQEVGFAIGRDVKVISFKMGKTRLDSFPKSRLWRGVIGQLRRLQRKLKLYCLKTNRLLPNLWRLSAHKGYRRAQWPTCASGLPL